MTAIRRNIVITLGIIILLFIYLGMYTVNEGQRALVLRLGKITTDGQGKALVFAPGLHFKTPFITESLKLDTRLQTLDVQSSRVLTKEQKYVLVDYYVKWKIQDLSLYYQRTGGDVVQTETLLQQKINNALRAAFGRRTITEVVSGQRGDVMDLLKKRADEGAQSLGVDIIDVRIKRIDLPEEVSSSVFDRMRVEREQAATRHRSEGRAQAEIVRAQADAAVTVTLAKARAKSAKIRATGDGQAAQIYISAFGKNLGFYAFLRSLEAYKNSFNSKKDILLLSPTGQFFKYFKGVK
ncbi:MAG: protease modulator HflC [Gammaproteobacteria bacterium]|nr:protease modulator HflC [Gammaproteobacteria bacterium]